MTWTRLGDNFDGQTINLSDAGFRTLVQARIWCNRNLTDGHLPTRAVRLVSAPDEAVDELVGAGWWRATETGYQLDWSDQETAEAVQARRQANASKQRAYRERRDLHAAGDHSKCDPRYCEERRVTGNETRSRDTKPDGPRDAYPSRPDPSPSRGQGKGASAAAAKRQPPRLESLSPNERALVDAAVRGFGLDTLPADLMPALEMARAERDQAA